MKKKAISACIGTLAMSMVLVSGVTTSVGTVGVQSKRRNA